MQETLFGGSAGPAPRARATDPSTSKAAAEAVDLNKRCAEVLTWVEFITLGLPTDGTFTDGELARKMSEDRNIVARRRKDLTDLGLV